MCIFFTINSARKSEGSSVILLDEGEFRKFWKSPYVDVLKKHEPPSNVSKSYFYYAYERLKALKVLNGKSLNFRLILPVRKSEKGLELGEGLAVNDSGKIIYWIEGDLYTNCDSCPVREDCVRSLRTAAKAFGLKVSSSNPREGWLSVVEKIRETALKALKAVEVVG